ncbi:QWRF motif-containing protein 2-like [Magnolia sinica]|uniref:QWRF motif-containing protein 2-like n=1 Tax=Magnolia sinica TaxID=86752 RepID=UPI002659AFAA|nr:QWRF motif-containing protein 2-like [Magnolia sinica]
MVAAISATPSQNNPKTPADEAHHHNPSRPPLLPSEKDNGVAPLHRKPKTREITSRYMSSSSSSSSSSYSSSSSRRCPSPLVSRGLTLPEPSIPKRAQSVERRRPITPRPTTPQPDSKHGNAMAEMSAAAKVLWTSTRSLSVSFQGESFSLPVSKVKAAPPQTPNLSRKATPERRVTPGRGRVEGGVVRDHQVENSKPIDQHRWPARARQSNPLTKSLDCTSEKMKPGGPLSGSVVRTLQQSMIDEGRRASFESRIRPDLGNVDVAKTVQVGRDADSENGSHVPCDLTASDTESVSSGSNSGVQEFSGVPRGRATPRGISVPARFWQETNSRLRRLQDPSSPLSTTGSRTTTPSKIISSKKALVDSPLSSPRTVPNSRALSSPLKGPIRHPSPCKLMVSSTSSPSRGMPSPSRMRNSSVGSVSNQPSSTPSILSFVADVRRGKMGENRIEDAHMLRLLYNRYLQWRFVNARADAAMSMQRLTAEKNLCNAWVTTSELRGSVTVKRSQLQVLRQKLKLSTILRGQMSYLEEWSLFDRDHSSSLSEAIEALKASTLRLPVTGGARADIQKVKDAVGSAVDVMQAMGSSICSLLSKLEGMNSLVTELASVAAQERALLDQCKNLLSTISAMQVEECSLRTHLLQLKRVPNLTQP